MTFTVLYVCTGNVCRSPGAERIFRARDRSTAFLVHSAGTAALIGSGIDASSATALQRLGVDPRGHRAQQFETMMAVRADLVLTAELAHRDHIMTEAPSAFRRTFTMREFARLVTHAGSGGPAEVVARAAAIRGLNVAERPTDDDVPDCFRADLTFASTVMAQVAETVQVTVDALSPGRPPDPRGPRPRARPRPTAATIRRRPQPHPPGG